MLSRTKLRTEVILQKRLHQLAYDLRINPTSAEQYLWKFLRKKQFLGLRFLRQYPIDKYIVDFICHEQSLIIEVDGGIHLLHKERDRNRDHILSYYGFRVLRFTNEEVLHRTDDVLTSISKSIINSSNPGLVHEDKARQR